jgi:CHAD domain-containing protein
MSSSLEVEDKYEVRDGFTVPDLAGVGAAAEMGQPVTTDLEATYFDTEDLRLIRNRLTLRRRTGGADEGWHLKLPSGTDRQEVHRPLGRARRVPKELAQLVLARTRGQELQPVARIRTQRTTYDVLDADGGVLAQVADDEVRAERLQQADGQVGLLGWHELEVELIDGDRRLLERVTPKLLAAGARPATSKSKLAHVLGDELADGDVPSFEGRLGPRSPAGEVIRRYLAEQVEAMLSWDLRVRLGEPDSVHKMRIATRRIRSTLRSYRRLLDQPRARDLDEKLKALAAELGVVRDAEVLQERLLGELAREPLELVHGPVHRHITERLHGQLLRGQAALFETLASDGYLGLVDELVNFVRTGVIDSAAANRPAGAVLPKMVARRYRKLARRAKAARRADASQQAQALHQARKAAKQVRYASDAIQPAFGADAAAFSKRSKRVQEVLGEHQDSVMATAILRDLGLAAHAEAGESSFTFGLLVGVEQARAAEARRHLQPVWSKASRRKYRRWLR